MRKRKQGKQRTLGPRQFELLERLIQPNPNQIEVGERLLHLLGDDEIDAAISAIDAEKGMRHPVSCATTFLATQAMRKILDASTAQEREILGWTKLKPGMIDMPNRIVAVVLGQLPARTFGEKVARFLAPRLTVSQVKWLARLLVHD